MECKDCSRFKPEKRIEAAEELSANTKGKCNVNNKACLASDQCGCENFKQK